MMSASALASAVRAPLPSTPRQPGCFAVEEIAWLREESVSISRRLGLLSIRDVHRIEPGFARLAAHPRILDLIERALEGRAVLVGSALHFAGAPELSTAPRDCLRVIADLGPSPDPVAQRSGLHGLGDVWVDLADGDMNLLDDKLIFALDFRRVAGPGTSRPASADDALWPQAAFCAG